MSKKFNPDNLGKLNNQGRLNLIDLRELFKNTYRVLRKDGKKIAFL